MTHIKTGWAISGKLVYKRGAIALAKKLAKRPELFENLSTTNPEKNKDAVKYFRECVAATKSAQYEILF